MKQARRFSPETDSSKTKKAAEFPMSLNAGFGIRNRADWEFRGSLRCHFTSG
jgi:hypothetical protein